MPTLIRVTCRVFRNANFEEKKTIKIKFKARHTISFLLLMYPPHLFEIIQGMIRSRYAAAEKRYLIRTAINRPTTLVFSGAYYRAMALKAIEWNQSLKSPISIHLVS